MVRLTRRLALYVGSLLALVAVYTVAYRWGMATLEGELELGEAFHLAEYPIDRDSEFFAVELEDG